MASGRPTISDIARLANTSTATVSNYLNGRLSKMGEPTRERIRHAIEQTGYVASAQARTLAGKPTGVIAVITLDNTNAWAGQVAAGIEAVATAEGYQTVVCNSAFDPARERSYVEKMLSLGVDGFIVQPTRHFRDVGRRIAGAGRPVVFYDTDSAGLDATWVKANLYDGVYDAVAECAERGYEHLLIVEDEPDARTRRERHDAAADAASARGLGCSTLPIAHEAPGASELAEWFRLNLNTARRTLAFVPHQWALGRVYQALMAQPQLVPDRVGLLGMNNGDWAGLATPSISTIEEPVREEGELACRMLIDRLRGVAVEPRQETLACSVAWRETTL